MPRQYTRTRRKLALEEAAPPEEGQDHEAAEPPLAEATEPALDVQTSGDGATPAPEPAGAEPEDKATPAPEQNLTLEARGRVVAWAPKSTETGPVCRITFETADINGRDLELLWSAQAFLAAMTLTFEGRSQRIPFPMAVGPSPASEAAAEEPCTDQEQAEADALAGGAMAEAEGQAEGLAQAEEAVGGAEPPWAEGGQPEGGD